MLHCLDPLRGMGFWPVAVRVMLAVFCGGLIGLEREYKRRPAGFRTHILICLGAAMTTATSQYLYLVMGYGTDLARLGAQVIAGVSFIGAGAIIMTKRRRVKGLTTTAGLWVGAIVGLCCGAGFYEGAMYATVLVLAAEMVFSKLEYRIMRSIREINAYVEYAGSSSLEEIMGRCHQMGVRVIDVEITRKSSEQGSACAIFTLQLSKSSSRDEVLRGLAAAPGVKLAEEV